MIATIGGVPRHLGAWKQSPLRMRGIKPAIDLAALPATSPIVNFPTDYDQGTIGSCGPNAVAEMYEYLGFGKRARLFLYWFTRAAENDLFEDGGVTIPDLITVAHSMGCPLETLLPYNTTDVMLPPSPMTIAAAWSARVTTTEVIVDLDHLLYELGTGAGQPITFGFGVPKSMQSDATAKTGVVNVPSATDPVIGGHCVNAIGYDRTREMIKCTAHYGPTYGDHGCVWLPYAHFTGGNATDMTAIRSITAS